MSRSPEELLAAMRARHQGVEEFSRLKARLRELDGVGQAAPQRGRELLGMSKSLIRLVEVEMELNQRLSAFAMGMQEAGAISSEGLNFLLGIASPGCGR